MFGDSLDVVGRYVDLLAGEGVIRGLIGPRETPRLWERHILNSAAVAQLLPDSGCVLDLGSGAGLPGIVLAILRPDLHFILLDANLRRTTFLEECVESLGMRNVTVRRDRAEEVSGQVAVDTVVARAVAPLKRLAEWALPLLKPGGRLLAVKGERAVAELQDAEPALRRLGAGDAEIITVDGGTPDATATVVVIRAPGDNT